MIFLFFKISFFILNLISFCEPTFDFSYDANEVIVDKTEDFVQDVQDPARTKPNVILLLADDLGYGDLGSANHPTSRTPNLDKMALSGRVLTQFYVTNPICSPSRASLLTGRYSVRSGVYPGTFTPSNYLGLPHNETTIAKIFKNQGYRTQMVGKWHLGVGYNREYLPTNFGFDDFLGLPYSHDMCDCPICFPNDKRCLSGCWHGYVSCALFDNSKIVEQPAQLPTLTGKFLDRSLKFIQKSKEDGKPFFLFFSFHHIHHPQFASVDNYGKTLRGATGDSLQELDSTVGKLMETLKQLGIENNTITWFTSDNGPSLSRHQLGGCAGLLRCGKGTTWEGGVRVPSIINWPTKIQPGKNNGLSSTLDILATLAALCGIRVITPPGIPLDGMDLSSMVRRQDGRSPREFFAVYPASPTPSTSPFAVIYGNYKAHFYTKGSDLSDSSNYDPMCPSKHPLTLHSPPLLFDLNEDPGERYDLGNKEEYKRILATITNWRNIHMKNIKWMPPRTMPEDPFAQPCCTSRTCIPYPSCCDCLDAKDQTQPRIQKKHDNVLITYLRNLGNMIFH